MTDADPHEGRLVPRDQPGPRDEHLVQAVHSMLSPHPTGDRVVATYVPTYDPHPRFPHQGHIPAMRPAQDAPVDHRRRSGTPIYDALYAEYRRSLRALPGDRSGEEELEFTAFSALEQHGGRHRTQRPAALPPAPRDGRDRGF